MDHPKDILWNSIVMQNENVFLRGHNASMTGADIYNFFETVWRTAEAFGTRKSDIVNKIFTDSEEINKELYRLHIKAINMRREKEKVCRLAHGVQGEPATGMRSEDSPIETSGRPL